MGGKSSKAESLTRSLSLRKSQKNSLQKIQRKLDKVSKDIHKFSGSVDDAKYTDIKKSIAQIIDELEKISSVVKDKHKDLYQDILESCNNQLQKLDMKVTHASRPTSSNSLPPQPSSPIISPIASPLTLPSQSPTFSPRFSPPSSPTNYPSFDSPLSERSEISQLKVVKVSVEEPKIHSYKDYDDDDDDDDEESFYDPQKEAINSIDQMRRKIENLEEKIHEYKQSKDPNLYEQTRTALNQIIIKLDNMETYGNVQIKYERKLALQRAQECMKYLLDGNKLQTQITLEMHQTTKNGDENQENENNIETRQKVGSYIRPVTLDLNANDNLKEELRQVLHKRIEEATMDDDDEDVDSGKKEERFDNTESEDDFDFVNVESGDKKTNPVLVTSL
nr:uncharacterized protein LOC111426661 [Onthophagus taurus]XP_022917059.1 uncharacterized protein LOC111426661 [Onthophagus taurus]